MGLGVAQICVIGVPVTMLAKEKKKLFETPKRFFLSIAGCVVDQKFVFVLFSVGQFHELVMKLDDVQTSSERF